MTAEEIGEIKPVLDAMVARGGEDERIARLVIRVLASFDQANQQLAAMTRRLDTLLDSGDVTLDESPAPLSPRETELLRHLKTGMTYEKIAEAMSVSVNTVRFHVRNAYRKLGVKTASEAIARHGGL